MSRSSDDVRLLESLSHLAVLNRGLDVIDRDRTLLLAL